MQSGPRSAIKGAVANSSPVALVITVMFSDFDSKELQGIFRPALAAAHRIALLRRRFAAAGIPIIYVNDNEGRWHSSGRSLIERRASSKRGKEIAELLMPQVDDYLVLKPKHSIFYATPLEVLLTYMRVRTLVLTGLTGIQCILFSAMDAYVRDFKIYAPKDCIVSQSEKDAGISDYILRSSLKADTKTSTQLRVTELRRKRTN